MLGWWWWWGVIRCITLKVRCFYDCLPHGKSYTRQRAFCVETGHKLSLLKYTLLLHLTCIRTDMVFGFITSVLMNDMKSIFQCSHILLWSWEARTDLQWNVVVLYQFFSSLTQISWISFAHSLFLRSPIIVKLCIRHGSNTIVFYTKLQNDKQINWCYRPPRLRKI